MTLLSLDYYLDQAVRQDLKFGVLGLHTDASESNLGRRVGTDLADAYRLLGKTGQAVVHFAGELTVLVEVCEMRRPLIAKLLQLLGLQALLLILCSLLRKSLLPSLLLLSNLTSRGLYGLLHDFNEGFTALLRRLLNK